MSQIVPITKFDMSTTVDLSIKTHSNKDAYQFLYAAQLHHTLFGVYGKFEFTEKDETYGETKGFEMVLINYEGDINIGFYSKEPEYNPVTQHLYFGVQGGRLENYEDFTFPKPLQVFKNQPLRLTFCRIAYPINGFQIGERDPKIRVTHESSSSIVVPPLAYFDNLYQSRSGVAIYNNPIREGMAGYKGIELGSIPKEDDTKGVVIASPRCTQSFVNLVY